MDVTLSFISDTKTEFTYFDKVADKIESAVYSLVKSITKIRTLMIFQEVCQCLSPVVVLGRQISNSNEIDNIIPLQS